MIEATYKTTDIVLAATLREHGYKLIDIEQCNTNKGMFVFKDVPRQLLTDFDLQNMQVEPISFNNTIKQLTTSVKRALTT